MVFVRVPLPSSTVMPDHDAGIVPGAHGLGVHLAVEPPVPAPTYFGFGFGFAPKSGCVRADVADSRAALVVPTATTAATTTETRQMLRRRMVKLRTRTLLGGTAVVRGKLTSAPG